MTRDRSKCCSFKDLLRRRIPIVGWLPQYSWSKLLQDALAGTTVGLTAIPQGIAYAVVAGLPPQYGLYSSFMGCYVYMIFGSTKDVTVGPTAIMGLLTHPFVECYGDDFAVLLCFLTGCLITAMGLLHLGFLIDFISMPVICGFTNAAAIIIASSQISTLLGISGRSENIIEAVKMLVDHYKEVRQWDIVLGFCSIIILVVLKNLPGKRRGNAVQKFMWLICLARNAVVVIIGMILAFCLSLYGQNPFKITGNITEGLPPFAPPPFSTSHNNETYNFLEMVDILGSSIASVPLIALLESIAIAKAFAKGKTLDSNQEMIAVGLCNLFGSFVRSMPTTGSFTRTAVNHASGVRTPMGGVVTGTLVLLACGLLTSTFRFIPKATLAAVIIVAMYYMLDIRLFQVLWKTKKIDLIPLVVTLVICLTAGLEYGMIIGIATNLVLLLYGTARPGLLIEDQKVNELPVLLVTPQQSLSFPAAEYLREKVMSWCDTMKEIDIVVIDGMNVNGIDATVAKNLSLLLADLEARKQRLIFWNWCEAARKTLVAFDSSIEVHFRNSASVSQLLSVPTLIANPIIGGTPDTDHVCKHQVSIHSLGSRTNTFEYICSGTIISERHILTAANCFMIKVNGVIREVHPPIKESTKIITGTNKINGPGVERDIIQVFIPKEYEAGTHKKADIAVALLSSELEVAYNRHKMQFLIFGEAFPHDYEANKEAVFSGFGLHQLQMAPNGKVHPVFGFSPINQLLKVRMLPSSECPTYASEICAKSSDDLVIRTSCTGDSGAGLVFEERVIGVLSSGPLDCNTNEYPTIFTRISSFKKFLYQAMTKYGNYDDIHVLEPVYSHFIPTPGLQKQNKRVAGSSYPIRLKDIVHRS